MSPRLTVASRFVTCTDGHRPSLCTACGVFPSEMTTDGPAAALFESPAFKKLTESNLTPRIGTVTDFVGTVLYLSSKAGSYLNGVTILSDGGMSQVWTANTRLS